MSYTELFYVTPKMRVRLFAEFHNSHLGASLVWHNLYIMHCTEWRKAQAEKRGYSLEFPSSDEDYQQVWDLFKNTKISECERAVLGSTFDFVILKREHFQRYLDDVKRYIITYRAGSLLQQAETILKLSNRKSVIGVCWNQTSVSADMGYMLKEKAKNGELWSLYDALQKSEEK